MLFAPLFSCAFILLQENDLVEFQVATDRRDALRRATNISLLDESFAISGEKRERGAIAALKVSFGKVLG